MTADVKRLTGIEFTALGFDSAVASQAPDGHSNFHHLPPKAT
jgi:hypothetical protein